MSDAYGAGYGGNNRDQIVQALMAIQNPPPGGAMAGQPPVPPGAPTPAGLPGQGGVAGAGSTPMPFAGAPGGPGAPNVGPPPGGVGTPPYLPPIGGVAGGGYPGGGQTPAPQPPMGGLPGGLPGQNPLIPDLSRQLPPGGLPRY
jgi:hypothetical protein